MLRRMLTCKSEAWGGPDKIVKGGQLRELYSSPGITSVTK